MQSLAPYHLGVDVTFALEVEREERDEEVLDPVRAELRGGDGQYWTRRHDLPPGHRTLYSATAG